MDITQLPGFEYGYPADTKWYGLWCPIFDCFLLVSCDKSWLTDISILSSGKFLTIVVELDLEDRESNVVDNVCCCNWTVTEPANIAFTKVYRIQHTIKSRIIQTVNNNYDNTDILEALTLLMLIGKYVRQINKFESQSRIIVSNLITPTTVPLRQQIYRKILMSDSVNEIIEQVNLLMPDV